MTQQTVDAVRVVLGAEEQAAAAAVLASGRLTQGAEVAAFEQEFADAFGAQHAVAVNSGTSALHVALLAAGIGPGDEVVVPAFTFAATANAVALTGATPVFADIDADTFCLDPAAAAAAIGPRTAGIVPVHLFGQVAAMDDARGPGDRPRAVPARGRRAGPRRAEPRRIRRQPRRRRGLQLLRHQEPHHR